MKKREGRVAGGGRKKEERRATAERRNSGERRLAKGLALMLNPMSLFFITLILLLGPKRGPYNIPPEKETFIKASLKYTRFALLTFRSEELRILAHHFLFSFPSGFFKLVIPP